MLWTPALLGNRKWQEHAQHEHAAEHDAWLRRTIGPAARHSRRYNADGARRSRDGGLDLRDLLIERFDAVVQVLDPP